MQSADSDDSARLKALDEIAYDWHVRAPTTDAHTKIAIHLWAQIKALGCTSGHLLAGGQDADLLAGHPPDAPRTEQGVGPCEDGLVLNADLLLLRRREPGHPASGLPFIERSLVHVHGRPDMLINACYSDTPWFALGTIVPDPIDPDLTTVAPANGNFEPHLSDVLYGITEVAVHHETTAQVRPVRGRSSAPPPLGRPPAPGPDLLGI
ncbi:hypothetical protein C8K30_115119 [Promicromonospora sp. AC04]|uniref:hypothetical protein n=1 Tax=Promicromonospora sp. AC04 TaxID=2135723 RepID=UPI000D3478A4|nr:hypothetical protein [Promicromonospora sp. AC04]PUB20908.1 hypothetical protein C8K30_115119 [Promicromonospora sp. AC04]